MGVRWFNSGGSLSFKVGRFLFRITIQRWFHISVVTIRLIGKKTIRDYEEKLRDFKDMPPHVFVIADQSLQGITFRDGLSQSIIIRFVVCT